MSRPGQLEVRGGAGTVLGYASVLAAPGASVVNGVLTLWETESPSTDYATLAAAVTAIGSTPTTLTIVNALPSGASTTVPVTLRLKFAPGGSIVLSSGHSVVINSDASAWPIAQIFSGSGTVTPNVAFTFYPQWFGAKGDGTTDNTSAINATIAAINAAGRGILYFRAGSYKVTGALTAITVPFAVMGDGHANTNGGDYVTKVFTTSATANLFTVSPFIGKFSDIALLNAAVTTPSAGAGILVTTPNLPGSPSNTYLGNQVDFERVYVGFFYDNISVESGAIWHMDGCTISHPVRYGLRVRNLNNADAGDWSINKTTFEQAVYQSESALFVESAGGGKISDVKVNGAGGASGGLSFNNAFNIALSTAASTSILLITNSSIENSRGHAISVSNGYQLVTITNMEFGQYGNATGELIHLDSVQRAILDNLVAQNSVTAPVAIRAISCTAVDLGAHEFRDYTFPITFDTAYTPGASKFMEVLTFTLFQNSWVNLAGHDTAGFAYFNGMVHLKGTVHLGTLNTTIFTLPIGFRPRAKKTWRVYNDGGSCTIQINTTGTVTQFDGVGNVILCLDGISFAP